MIVFPNAKVNIGLNILSKRADGYHNIESLLYPIGWKDILEIVKSHSFGFKQTGIRIDGPDDANLCLRAYQLLCEEYDLPPVQIHLHKVIPMGAGLGGGSSDAAFTLKVLNELFELNLNVSQLQEYASVLGSDCPFFIENIPALISGTGTSLSAFAINLSGKFIVVVYPHVHVSTKEAYHEVKPQKPDIALSTWLMKPCNQWTDGLVNDFEASLFQKYPEIKRTKRILLDAGAIYASMSGSGSAVYGIFDRVPQIEENFGNKAFTTSLSLAP